MGEGPEATVAEAVYRKSATRDTFESLIVTAILAVFGTTFVLQAFKIPTGSMENTLLIGDHLLVNKFVFAPHSAFLSLVLPYGAIHRDDIVVFKFPASDGESQEPGEHFVKRVIGLPGDRIRIVARQVYVNGQPVEEPFVRHSFPGESRPGDDMPSQDPDMLRGATLAWSGEIGNYLNKAGELTVPPDKYFVMGDNREQSWDSRFWGFVPRELISGRPLIIYWSYETPRDEYLKVSLFDRVYQTVDMILHFVTKTRWRRTFNFVR